MFVDFFGRPASTHKAIALLAIEHQAPVVVGVARRVGPGFRYEIGCADIIEPAELTAPPTTPGCSPSATPPPSKRLIRRDPSAVPLAAPAMEASATTAEGTSG